MPICFETDPVFREVALRAAALDAAGAFPSDDIAALRGAGVLRAPLPARFGGEGVGTTPGGADAILRLLWQLGRANLSVARLVEAHVNALRLVLRFGDEPARSRAAADAADGHLFGLWVTDAGTPVSANGDVLDGRKGPCSGAGHCTRALVTAAVGDGVRMAVVALGGKEPVVPVTGMGGMRSAANGVVTLTGVPVRDWIGAAGDYLREPDFSCGAWRASAAAGGALAGLVEAVGAALVRRHQVDAPLQVSRFGEMVTARETARLWVQHMAAVAEHPGDEATQVATVNLGRGAVERACLDAIRHAQRSLGMAAFVAPQPAERIIRDLGLYLRQPAVDAVLLEAASWHLTQHA